MPRSRVVLNDPDRREVSQAIMDAQILQDETARILAERVHVHVKHSRALRRAQERLTASELRAERDNWDGATNRRQFERRSGVAA